MNDEKDNLHSCIGRLALFISSAEFKRFVKFLLVGASGILVNYGFLWALPRFTGMDYRIALVLAIEASILSNFVLNNFYTFSDRNIPGVRSFFGRMSKFNLISLPGGAFNFITTTTLTAATHKSYLVVNIIGILVATIWNYLANYFWTWKKKPSSQSSG